MGPAAEAAVGIVGFFAVALLLAGILRTRGVTAAVVVVWLLLAVALVFHMVLDSPAFALVALVLAVLAAVLRFAFDAAAWVDDRTGGRRS